MALYVKGALADAQVIKEPQGEKAGVYAYIIRDQDGTEVEVLSSRTLGAQGEVVEIEVNPQVRRGKDGSLTDRVSLWVRRLTGAGGQARSAPAGFHIPAQLKSA